MVKQLLVVDDDPTLVNLLKESLEGDGYHVDAAYDGLAALRRIGESKPDALIIDLNMPGLNGSETVQRLRQDAVTAQLPVVLLTGETSERIPLPKDPHTIHLEKPIDLETLTACLQQLL